MECKAPSSVFDVTPVGSLGLAAFKGKSGRFKAKKFAITFPRCAKSPEDALASLLERWQALSF